MSQKYPTGDVMYHPILGKLSIMGYDPSPRCINRYSVKVLSKGTGTWVPTELLSYEPWPQPVTKPPLKEGYYLVEEVRLNFYKAMFHFNGRWDDNYQSLSQSEFDEKWKIVKFVGMLEGAK